MKLSTLALGVGCAAAAGCGVAPAAPASAPNAGIDIRLDPPPVHALIGHRSDLDLSPAQIEELDAVGQEIHAATHPLLVQLRNIDDTSRGNGQARLLALAGQIHLNNHRAMERVRGVLSEGQRSRACGLFAGTKTSARGLRAVEVAESAFSPTQRVQQFHVASQRVNGAVWSWCAEPGTTTAAR